MEFKFLSYWHYFIVRHGQYRDGSQFARITIRALSPRRKKVIVFICKLITVVFASVFTYGIGTPVLDGIKPTHNLLFIPLLTGGVYLLTTLYLLSFCRKEKHLIIDERQVRIQKWLVFWRSFDRDDDLAFVESNFSARSNAELERELINEQIVKNGKASAKPAYYKYSKKIVLEFRGIPSHLLSVYGLTLAELIHRRLQDVLNRMPLHGGKKNSGTAEIDWGKQAGGLEAWEISNE